MSDCVTCSEVKKTEQQARLEKSKADVQKKAEREAKQHGAEGYFIAISLNRTGYIFALERPTDSALQWDYVSID